MNLNDLQNCPLSDEDLDSFLRLLFFAQEKRVGVSVSYNPQFEYVCQWEITIFYVEGTIWIGGRTLEECLEKTFERIRECQ